MSKEELIQLVQDIMMVNGSEEEVDRWLDIFVANVPHPQAANLIFYPEQVFGNLAQRELTPAEIVEIALDYQPIIPV
jgi:Colicin immunity protein / pyocin immunity protein